MEHKIDNTGILISMDTNIFLIGLEKIHQPSSMGLVKYIEVGYKLRVIKILFFVFGAEGGYQQALKNEEIQNRRYKSLDCVIKPHLLGAMNVIHILWEADEYYAQISSIKHFWFKADISPYSLEWDIHIDDGSA